jgi:hypothetical protein
MKISEKVCGLNLKEFWEGYNIWNAVNNTEDT